MGRDRFPGLRAFEKKDAKLFFGRDTETKELMNTIVADRTTILFGDSGTGKSSLLNTALSTKLNSKNYLPVRIKFSAENKDVAESPTTIATKAIRKALREYGCSLHLNEVIYDKESPRLWEVVKQADLTLNRSDAGYRKMV